MKYQTCEIVSSSVAETEKLASKIGRRLRGGEIIELASDLGGGKTTFTRGLAAGAGSKDGVASPTFTINRVYKAKEFDIHHFDFYRLQDAGLAAYELHDLLHDQGIVIVVEWANVVEHVLPGDRLTIQISQTGDTTRTFTCRFPNKLSYLVEELC